MKEVLFNWRYYWFQFYVYKYISFFRISNVVATQKKLWYSWKIFINDDSQMKIFIFWHNYTNLPPKPCKDFFENGFIWTQWASVKLWKTIKTKTASEYTVTHKIEIYSRLQKIGKKLTQWNLVPMGDPWADSYLHNWRYETLPVMFINNFCGVYFVSFFFNLRN